MVVHEVILDFKVKEICAINGGAYGGNNVNDKFISVLKDLLGAEFINRYIQDEPVQWFNFLTKFERFKKSVENEGKKKLKIEIPYSMFEMFDTLQQGNTLVQTIKNAKDKGIAFASGSLVLSHNVVEDLFTETTHNIVKGVRDVFQNAAIEHIDYLFMVGGFSECTLLQKAIKETFEQKGCRVLVPHEAQLAIIKGAVLYGHYQDQVISRIARKTYGCFCNRLFNLEIHDVSKRFTDPDGEIRCSHIFWSFIEIGEELNKGSCVEKIYGLLSNQHTFSINIYSLHRRSKVPVEYTDDPDMTMLGTIRVDTPNKENKANRKLKVKMTFGSTEILVEATDDTTGYMAQTTIDFLSE